MRVITGKYRGRSLNGPKHEGLRPTSDRVREALFNIIGPKISDASLLDLFAGTGAIGIEALSRGANSVVFNDHNQQSIKLIKKNLEFVDPGDQYRILQTSAVNALEILFREGLKFDIIFLDPPFAAGILDDTIKLIANYHLLQQDGILIVEHPKKLTFDVDRFQVAKVRNYGDVNLTLLINQ